MQNDVTLSKDGNAKSIWRNEDEVAMIDKAVNVTSGSKNRIRWSFKNKYCFRLLRMIVQLKQNLQK